MTSEMELLRMDERQRLAWLLANRGTVVAVGATWLGMIVWELASGRTPWFLIAMVPVFALLRVGLFFYYCASPVELGGRPAPGRVLGYVKPIAATCLALALVLPLYSVGRDASLSASRQYGYAWDLLREDPLWVVPLALAFLWPLPLLALLRRARGRRAAWLLHVAQPLLAAASGLVILWIPQVLWDFRFFVLWLIPLPARAEIGCYVAIGADGLYLIGWLAGLLAAPARR